MKQTIKKLLITSSFTIILIMVFSSSPGLAGVSHEGHDYHVQANQEDVLLNKTYTMSKGEINEENITITSDNSSLTLVVEVIHQETTRKRI